MKILFLLYLLVALSLNIMSTVEILLLNNVNALAATHLVNCSYWIGKKEK